MGKVLDYLTSEWVDERLAKYYRPPEDDKQVLSDYLRELRTKQALCRRFPEDEKSSADLEMLAGVIEHLVEHKTTDEEVWSGRARECMEQCELEYAAGADMAGIRRICREFTEQFVPVIKAQDFAERRFAYEGVATSTAKDFVDRFGGKWWKMGRWDAGVEYMCIPQPHELAMPYAWMIAGTSGDRELAREFAASYKVYMPSQLRRQFEIRDVILRHALADDHEDEESLAAKLKPGYADGWPPPLIELPLGVIHRDTAMVVEGVRKLGTKMKGKWDVKKHRRWYDKQVAKYEARGRSYSETWETCLAHTKGALVGGHWVLSWWAMAWLNIARWRGMDKVFEDRKVFSEWVPMVDHS